MNRKALMIAVTLLTVAMLATPLVSAKPAVWSVTFSLTTMPDMSADPDLWSKYNGFAVKNGMLVVDKIPTIGTVELVHGSTTMTGEVTQMVLCGKIYVTTSMRAMGNEKWVFMFDDAEGSTFEISANFWIDDLPNQPNGAGTCLGTHGTGVFEDAIFKGTFTTIMIPQQSGAILKIQYGSGEIKFP